MQLTYLGKRKTLGERLSKQTHDDPIAVIDLICLSRQEARDFASTALAETPPPHSLVLLSAKSGGRESADLIKYYTELEHIVRTHVKPTGVQVRTLLAPAVIEELSPYLTASGKIFGSYPESAMPWVTTADLASAVTTIQETPDAASSAVPATLTASVEQALSHLAGRKVKRISYHHLPPNILADAFRQRGLSKNDSQVADQLPYYQYHVGHLPQTNAKERL
ncbi:hypothetical protein [Actinomyces lilanjuaniae]|uniref:hypothetical protein n=1 Tax=Actinomyces lilanjuaniae TaxID=2321394 RepID=UPI0013C45D2B|nr:hypothetical protein [Actinomyces lilanjuaniae]